MKRLVLVLFAAGVTIATGLRDREMKVKVYCSRTQLGSVAKDVLEFYQVDDNFFVGAVREATYQKLLRKGYQVEVLIADMEEEAKRECSGDNFGRYHSYQEIMDTFALIANSYPNICHLDTIAVSPTGKYVIALKITQNPTSENHRPRLEWDGTTHGNENIGTEICWFIVRQLTENYGSDSLITYLVNTREIWVIPCVNPEGLINRTRGNSNDIDLNRDYGYAWNQESGANVPWSQPEISGIRGFFNRSPFVMTMTYHSGSVSVMWPWSYSRIATYDSVAHSQWCQEYGSITGYPAYQISRGLYECQGTSTDFYYGAEGALGFAAEVASGQPPPQEQIDTICRANWTASKQWMIKAGYGLRGYITDSVTGLPVKRAMVISDPTNWMIYTDTCGWFFKYVPPGTYTIKIMADGYETKTLTNIVVPNDTFVVVPIVLKPDTTAPITGYKITTWICKNPTAAGNTMGLFALGRQDNQALTLTQRGMTVIEFSQPIINDSGTDFIVYSNSNKPCSVLVSTDWNGPWSFCAYDTGSIAVDLSIAGVSLANFVRLNDGGQSYDLDAIEGKVVNAPALVLESKVVIDSPPGGNGDGRLDPAEMAELVLALRNAGRVGANNVTGLLRTDDEFVSIIDSTGGFGDILPDSVRSNISDRFAISADSGTPQEHIAEMKVYLYGTDYSDSIRFCIVVGELRIVDPIPDNSQPTLYRAYDEVDTLYREHPAFEWVEVRNLGTRLLNLSDDETRQVNLPPSFGPFVFYGVSYHQLSICSNGWIAPGYTTVREWRNTTLPNTSMPPLLAANWDDLYPPTGNGVWYYHDTVNHRFIIEWDSVHYVNPGSQWDKFEIILYDTTMAAEDGNSKFCFQYLTANQPGTSATIGIQDHTKTKLIQAVYNGSYHRAASPWIPGRSLKFSTDWQTGVAEVSPSSPFEQLNIKPLVNPSKGTVNLRYSLPSPTRLVLVIYDRCGRAVQRFDIGEQHAGRYCLKWNLTDIRGRYVGAGVYWVKLITEQGSVTTKMTILR